MKIAALQHDVVWEDAKATHAHVAPMIEGAAGAGARIVVLTEMFATGFSLDSERIQERPDGPSATFLAEQARLHSVWVAASICHSPQASSRLALRKRRLWASPGQCLPELLRHFMIAALSDP